MNGIERERTSLILVIFIQYCFDIVMSIFSIYYEICKCLIPLMYWAMYDAFGGKKCIPYRYVINSQVWCHDSSFYAGLNRNAARSSLFYY